jgi:hypothetical protein
MTVERRLGVAKKDPFFARALKEVLESLKI